MRAGRYLLISFAVVIMIVMLTLLIPKSHAYILSKLTTHFLHVKTTFASPDISWDAYHIEANLDKRADVTLNASYAKFSDFKIDLFFSGNSDLFSKVADTELPHIDTNLTVRVDKRYKIKARANLLEGNLTAAFDMDTSMYQIKAEHLSLLSYQNQQKMLPYSDGFIALNSTGIVADRLDININLESKKLLLLPRAKRLLQLDLNASPTLINLNTELTFKSNILQGAVQLDSNLADIAVEQLHYDLNKSTYDIALHVNNHYHKYDPLKHLHVRSYGRYKDDILEADALVNVDGYLLELDKIRFKDSTLNTEYKLHSADHTFVDITAKHALYGNASYAKTLSEATITSSLLKDTVSISFEDQHLHVSADALSLAGILAHLKQEKMATGDLKLDARADFSEALMWQVAIDSDAIQLSSELNRAFGNKTPLSLHVSAFPQDDQIIIDPIVTSTMAKLDESRVIYDAPTSRLHVKAKFKDINLSSYHSPSLVVDSQIDLVKPLHVKGSIDTPFESLSVDLNKTESSTQAVLHYDIARLDRFAALNPDFDIKGSGTLVMEEKGLQLALDTKQFDRIEVLKDDENITLKADKITLERLFELTQQSPIFDANLSILAKMTPHNIALHIDTPRLQPREHNASLRTTALHVSLGLDGNISHYNGELLVKTDHEILTCKPLSLSPERSKLQSDFRLKSDDLRRGTPILPDFLEGATTFYGTVDFEKELALHVKNDAIHFSKAFYQKIDANATDGFDITMRSDVDYSNNNVFIDAWASSPFFDLNAFTTQIDLNRSTLLSDLQVSSDSIRSKSAMHVTMHYSNPFVIDANVSSDYERVMLDNIRINTENIDLNGSYSITLLDTPPTDLFKHGSAEFYGQMRALPEPQATLKSDSFDGILDLKLTQKQINLNAKGLSLQKVMALIQSDSALKSGTLDLRADLKSDNFLELNTSMLKGDIALNGTDLLLEGIDADKSINTLKNYQDISLFEGNFPGKSIVSALVEAPIDLLSEKEIPKSKINRLHADSYIEEGRFYCYDCAVKTAQNRIALKGAIDLNTTEFHYFEVGLLRKNDCAFFTQDIKGSLDNPEIELSKTSLKLITGTVESVGGILKDGVDLGTSLISKTGEFAGKSIDMTTGYIPGVNKATGVLSKSITEVTDAPDSANKWLTHKCRPFYRGVVRPSDANVSSLLSSVESTL